MLFALHILCLCAMVATRSLLKLSSSPHPHPLPDFHQVCVSFYKKFYQPFFALMRLLHNMIHFQSKTDLFFQLIAVFYMYFLRVLFHSSVNMKLRIASYLYICVASYLAPHQIIWHNKSIPGHCLKITSNYSFFGFKFKVDTISIISSYLYYFRKINKELFRYC